MKRPDWSPFFVRIVLLLAWSGLALSGWAQELRLLGISTDSFGRPHIRHTSRTNYYYLLLSGRSLGDVQSPGGPVNSATVRELELGRDGIGELTDPISQEATAFYRVQEVSLDGSLDTDGDGLKDVLELSYRPRLDPLSSLDAGLDPDRDGRTTLEEIRKGTDPFVAERPGVPVLIYPTNATTASFVIFSGSAPTNTVIRVEGGAANLTNTVDATGQFELTVPLIANRLNRLFVTAVDEFGEPSPPAPVDVLQDSTPPYVFVDFPTNGMVLTAATTLVAGRVGDTLSGFLGLSVTVTNLSIPASSPSLSGGEARVDVGIGPNGTFERGQLPLAVGANQIRVVAVDRLGNAYPTNITVTRIEPTGPRLSLVSGDLQETNILRRLAEPLVVRLASPSGAPLTGYPILFQVTRSDGRILPLDTNQLATDISGNSDYSTNGSMTVSLLTDAAGEAQVWYRMGTDAGHANNRITVSASNVVETVFFCASATHLPARQINIGSGNHQRGETFGPATEPLKVWVSDGNNPVAGVPVTFRATQGEGKLVPILTDDGVSPSGPGLRGSRPATSVALISPARRALARIVHRRGEGL